MVHLQYKTRGNSTPQGKPRVYFTSHPDDFGVYFSEIVADIEKTQNCAIYYDTDLRGQRSELELRETLSQMQLFVIPVTSNFLFQENRARQVEFAFAVEHHIPVLPIMMEKGLETHFNGICGNLQFLNKAKVEPTEIPYEEKLKNFLNNVLIGGRLAEQVRKAFDAYIFLSYRKKDRERAQELMRLIHNNEFCRDIAIWYDEFLIPGEDFNDAIRAAMEKSGLFVLAVTPNLVNEVNYVMTTEYPVAKMTGKPILPAEMIETDHKQLEKYYPEIPTIVNAGKQAVLSEALLECIKQIAIQPEKKDPQHNYFIGLAYLNGIDVEVDRERAVDLITGAAECGLEEAMNQLILMYRTGAGVEINHSVAMMWNERLIELSRRKYYEGSSVDFHTFFNRLLEYGDYLYEMRVVDLAENIYRELYNLSKKHVQSYESYGAGGSFMNAVRRYLVIGCNQMGFIEEQIGKYQEAEYYYRQGLQIAQKIDEEENTAESRDDLSVSYDKLGRILEKQGRFEEAEVCCRNALLVQKDINYTRMPLQVKRQVMMNYHQLGTLMEAQNRLEEAKKYHIPSLKLAIEIEAETHSVNAKDNLAVAYARVGNIAFQQNRYEEAEQYYYKALKIRERLEREVKTTDAKDNLAMGYEVMGTTLRQQQKFAEAESYYKRSLELRRSISTEVMTIDAICNFIIIYQQFGIVMRLQEKWEGAIPYYLNSLKLQEQYNIDENLQKKILGIKWVKSMLMDCYEKQGMAAEKKGDGDAAIQNYQKALDLCEELRENTLAWKNLHMRLEENLTICYRKIGEFLKIQKMCAEAEKYYVYSVQFAEKIVQEFPKAVEFKRSLLLAYKDLTDICGTQGKYLLAEQYQCKLTEVQREILLQTGEFIEQQHLYEEYDKLGYIAYLQQEYQLSINYYQEALSIAIDLYQKTHSTAVHQNIMELERIIRNLRGLLQ